MLGPAQIENLVARKRLLVAECDAHRRAFALELAQVQASAAVWAHPFRSLMSVSRLFVLAAPIAGFVLGRRKRPSGGWLKMGLVGWQMFRGFQPLWARFRTRRDDRRQG